MKCGTLDILCLHIQEYGTRIGIDVNFNIVGDLDRFSIIKDLLIPKERSIRSYGRLVLFQICVMGYLDSMVPISPMRVFISWKVIRIILRFKLAGWTNGTANGLNHALYKPYLIFYQHYQRYLERNKLHDVDDLLLSELRC